jgi:hypothetical protein
MKADVLRVDLRSFRDHFHWITTMDENNRRKTDIGI